VVALGSLGRQKGFDVLIEAARLARGDWTAVVYGSGPQLPSLAGQVAASGQAARVRFAGWVERPDEHIREAQVVCMPSRWESFPYVALEAAAAGRPVVGSRVDGLDEIILSEETGLLVASECPAELATALDRLAASPDLIPLWGVAAHRRVSNHYRLDQMVDGVLEIYADAIRPA
jgi:glycosyltransferase involved in cell wall biosynthesis